MKQELFDKYTKIKYQSEPIGKEKIVLYLTTFDLEAFKNDEKLEKIPEKRVAKMIEFDRQDIMNNPNFEVEINKRLEEFVKATYEEELLKMKSYIELNRYLPKAQWLEVK